MYIHICMCIYVYICKGLDNVNVGSFPLTLRDLKLREKKIQAQTCMCIYIYNVYMYIMYI